MLFVPTYKMKTNNRWLQGLVHILVILSAVAAFMAVIQIRTDLAVGWVDSAIYHSLFLNKAEQIQRFGAIYFAGRWPWVLFGSMVFNAFLPALASAVFAYCVLSLIALSTYSLAKCFMTPVAAVLSGILAACNLQVAQTVVAGYPSAAAMALFFLGAALSVVGWRRNIVVLQLVAGLMYGLAVMTHPFIAVVGAPIYGVLLLMHWKLQSCKRLLIGLSAMIAGGLVILPVSLIVFRGYALSGDVLTTMWAMTRYSVIGGLGGRFSKTLDGFLLDGGSYLYFFAAVLVVVVAVARSGWRWSNVARPQRIVHLLYLAPLCWLLAWDWLIRGAALQYAFYQVFLYGVAALQLGMLAAQAGLFDRHPLRALIGLVLAYLALSAAVLAGLDADINWFVVLGMVAGILLVAGLGQVVTKKTSVHLGLSATLVLGAGVAAGLTRYGLSVHAPSVKGAPAIEVAKWALQIAKKYTGPTQPMLFSYNRSDYILGSEYPVKNDRWDYIFDGRRSFFNIFDTVAGVYLWERSMLFTEMSQKVDPELPNQLLKLFKKASLLVMWTDKDRRSEISEKLSTAGFRSNEVEAGTFNLGPFHYSWAIFQLENNSLLDR